MAALGLPTRAAETPTIPCQGARFYTQAVILSETKNVFGSARAAKNDLGSFSEFTLTVLQSFLASLNMTNEGLIVPRCATVCLLLFLARL